MSIKFAFFDLYGTLATFYPPREEIQKQAAMQFGLHLTSTGITRGYAVADKMLSEQNAVKPIKSMSPAEQDDFFTRFEKAVLNGDGHTVDDEIARKIWHIVKAQNATFKMFPDVIENLTNIRNSGIKNAIISNMNYTGARLEKEFNLPHLIEFIVTSHDAGVEKPHPQIFKYALAKAAVEPAEAIFVGDQILSDIQGAQNAGILPVLLDRYDNYSNYTDCLRVSDMTAIYDWLKNFSDL